MAVLDRATRPQRAILEPAVEKITAKLAQIDGAILTGRMASEQYQFEAGRRAGLSEALRIIEGQQGRT
jgi:hypothetical protein